jgi:hypothetical protein
MSVSEKVTTVIIGCDADFRRRDRISREEVAKIIQSLKDYVNLSDFLSGIPSMYATTCSSRSTRMDGNLATPRPSKRRGGDPRRSRRLGFD